MLESNFWQNKSNSQKIIKEKKLYEDLISSYNDSVKSIGRSFDRPSSSIYNHLARTGGIRPRERKRSPQRLSLSEPTTVPQSGNEATTEVVTRANCWVAQD